MKTNELLRQCLSEIPNDVRAEFDLSFEIAERIDFLLKENKMSQRDLAIKMGKKESQVSKWLTGRHAFSMRTLAQISVALGAPIIEVAK